MDELLGSLRGEDAVTPGRTARVHVLRWLRVLLTVRVAEQKQHSQRDHQKGAGTSEEKSWDENVTWVGNECSPLG